MSFYYIQDKNNLISFSCVWINGGSIFDKQNKRGLNNILTSLLSRGCYGYDNFSFSEYVDSYGAELNFDTSEDGILITLKSLKKFSDKLNPLLNLIIEKPNLDKEEFLSCKIFAKNHLIKSRENPFNIAFENWRRITYSDHPYSYEVNGYLEDIDNINYEDIISEYNQFKSRNKIFLSNFKTKLSSSKNINQLNNNHKIKNIYQELNSSFDFSSERIIEYSLDSNQLIIMLGSQTCPINCKDFLILKLLEAHLSFGMSSELFKQFREEKGFTYDQGIFFPSRMLKAPFLIYLSVSNENALAAYKLLINIWERLKRNNLTEAETELARKKLYGYTLHSQQTLEDVITRKAKLIGYGVNHNFDDNLLNKIGNIKPKEIRQVANKYFKYPYLSIVGKSEITKEIKNLWNKVNDFYI